MPASILPAGMHEAKSILAGDHRENHVLLRKSFHSGVKCLSNFPAQITEFAASKFRPLGYCVGRRIAMYRLANQTTASHGPTLYAYKLIPFNILALDQKSRGADPAKWNRDGSGGIHSDS
jgi:hypothetical protein